MATAITLIIIIAGLIFLEELQIHNETNFFKNWKDRWLSRKEGRNEKRNNL